MIEADRESEKDLANVIDNYSDNKFIKIERERRVVLILHLKIPITVIISFRLLALLTIGKNLSRYTESYLNPVEEGL